MATEIPPSEFGAGVPEDAPTAAVGSPQRPQAGHFYRVDSSRSSFRELWRDTRSPLVLLAWITKLLRVKVPGSVNDPNVPALHPFLLDAEEVESAIPPEVQDKLEPVLRELTDLGFSQPLYFAFDDAFHYTHAFHVAMLHHDGRSVARVVHRVEGMQRLRTHFFTEFLSGLASGRTLLSSSARSQMLAPPGCQLNWNHRASVSQLWVSHRQQLDAARCSGESVLTIRTPEAMLGLLEAHHEAVRDFQLGRGVFSSMRGEDLAQVQALDRNLEQARAGQMRHPEVMAQLERLQQKRTSWTSAILVLIVSLALFVGASSGMRASGAMSGKRAWEFLLIILGVLFVHESGHYLAMKLFHYRNVRMFFIPFFGAAVSGQNYTAPGWKKVIVSLMGPLPGIALGGALGIAGLIKGNDLMVKVGMFATILNGFQLLPVLPLDGGRILHSVLFCRHYSMDVLFRVLAGGLLLLASALSTDKFLMYLGIFMLAGIPTAFKIAKTATELRREKLVLADGQVADEHSIPVPVAQAIIDRMKLRFPKLKNPRSVATLTLQTYEMLAARPPGVAVSIGFLVLHGASFLVALLLFAVLLIPQFGGWGAIYQAAAWNPRHVVDTASMVSSGAVVPSASANRAVPPAAGAKELRDHDIIVASFPSLRTARQTYDELLRQSPARTSLGLFGQSVFISLLSADERTRATLFTEFETRTKEVYIDGAEGFTSLLMLTCMPAQRGGAEAIRRELGSYLGGSKDMWLTPPWADGQVDRRSESDRAQHALARATYQKLQNVSVYNAPEMKALDERISRAARRGNKAEHRRLMREQTQLRHDLQLRQLQDIRDGADAPVVRELVERYIAIEEDVWNAERAAERTKGAASQPATAVADEEPGSSSSEDGSESDDKLMAVYRERHRRVCRELGPMMGQLPLLKGADRPAPLAARFSARGYSQALRTGLLGVRVEFEDVAHGAPALVRWLQDRGCSNFKYDLSSSDSSDYDEEE